MPNEWQQVNIRVKPDTFDRWQGAADSEYGGMTSLIRTSVRRELAGDHDDSGGGGSASAETVTDLAETVDSLNKSVSSIERKMTGLQESIEGAGPNYSFKAAVRETVPSDAAGLTAGQIAARLDANSAEVREVLDSLEEDEEVMRTPEGDDRSGEELAWRSFEVGD